MTPIFSFLNLTHNQPELFSQKLSFVIRTMTNSCSQPFNPIKEEIYALIGCLNRLQKKYELSLGFHADFIKAQFLPYIYNKLSRWDGDIKKAVELWCSDPTAAEEKYGRFVQVCYNIQRTHC